MIASIPIISVEANEVLRWGIVGVACLIAAITDVRTRRIPNWLTGPLVAGGLVWSIVVGGLVGGGDSLGGCLLLACPYVALFIVAGGGAGDAKLMAGIGAWLGLKQGIVVLLAVALAGVVLAFGYALAKKHFRPVVGRMKQIVYSGAILMHRHEALSEWHLLLPEQHQTLTMPYGVAILTGVCAAAGVHFLW